MSLIGRWTRRLLGQPDPPRVFDWGRGHIDWDRELPFLQEQIRSHWSAVPIRMAGPTLLDNFTCETDQMRLGYRRALAEPTIKAALLGKIFAVMSLKVQVKPASTSPFDKEVSEFVHHALTRCQGGLPDLVWQILSGGLLDGFSVCEKVYREEERGRFKGKKSLFKLKAKDSRYIQFEIDAFRNVVRIFNMRGNAGAGFPPSDCVLFKYLSLFESPWGMSDLRAAHRAAEMIPKLVLLRMIFLDKLTGGFLHIKVRDPALVEEMKENAAKARAGGFIITTPDDEIELKDLATRGTSEFTAAMEDLRKEVAIGISGAFLHMMTGGGNDQRGNSEVQQDTVDLFIWALKTLVEQCINEQLVGDLVDTNYGATTDLPTVMLEAPNPEEIVNQLKIYESLHILELPLSKKALYELSGAVPPDPSDPTDALNPPSATAPGIAATGIGKGLPGGNPLTKPAGKFDEDDEEDEDEDDEDDPPFAEPVGYAELVPG